MMWLFNWHRSISSGMKKGTKDTFSHLLLWENQLGCISLTFSIRWDTILKISLNVNSFSHVIARNWFVIISQEKYTTVYCYIFLLFVFLISKTIFLIFPGFESWLLLEFFSFFLFHTADPNFCPFFCQKHLKLSLAFIKQSFCHCFSSWITIDSLIQIT